MDLDQDFTSVNLYTLQQRQNMNTLSEELILKSSEQFSSQRNSKNNYSWLFGASAFQVWARTDGPR